MGAQQRLFALDNYPEEFEDFWKAYPKRNGRKGDKKLACERWSSLDRTEKRWALAAAKKMALAAEAGEATCDAERFFAAVGTPKWMQYAEDEMRKDRRALEIVTDLEFDPTNPESVAKLRASQDPNAKRVARLMDEGYFS